MTTAIDLHGPPHVARYLETNGEDGFHWRNGTTILLLFTTGRKSGEERVNALIFRETPAQPAAGDPDSHRQGPIEASEGPAFTVIASKGGAPEPPAWFLNIEADPDIEIQIKGDRFPVRARVATPEEKPAMWAAMCEHWPDYDDYQSKTDREIPVVVLERR